MSGPERPIRARDVECPVCGAGPGMACVLGPRARDPQKRSQPVGYTHQARPELAREREAERLGRRVAPTHLTRPSYAPPDGA